LERHWRDRSIRGGSSDIEKDRSCWWGVRRAKEE